MRHRCSGKQLSRNASHRHAMFKNMMASLILHERIFTTVTKAKELRRFIEPMITLAKVDNLANRRLAFARLRNRDAVTKVFTLAQKFATRNGGYTRVLKAGFRPGDKAPKAMIEFVE